MCFLVPCLCLRSYRLNRCSPAPAMRGGRADAKYATNGAVSWGCGSQHVTVTPALVVDAAIAADVGGPPAPPQPPSGDGKRPPAWCAAAAAVPQCKRSHRDNTAHKPAPKPRQTKDRGLSRGSKHLSDMCLSRFHALQQKSSKTKSSHLVLSMSSWPVHVNTGLGVS